MQVQLPGMLSKPALQTLAAEHGEQEGGMQLYWGQGNLLWKLSPFDIKMGLPELRAALDLVECAAFAAACTSITAMTPVRYVQPGSISLSAG